MIIKDPVFGKYSIHIGMNGFSVREPSVNGKTDKEVRLVSTRDEALAFIIHSRMMEEYGELSLSEYNQVMALFQEEVNAALQPKLNTNTPESINDSNPEATNTSGHNGILSSSQTEDIGYTKESEIVSDLQQA